MLDLAKLAQAVISARLDGTCPAPTGQWYGLSDLENSYGVQERVLSEILRRRGGSVIGRKVGCTNQLARELLDLDTPFHGALLSTGALTSPARIARGDYSFLVLEPEFALRLGRTIGPADGPHTAESVAEAVDAVLPALELVSSCHEDWTRCGPGLLIADNGSSYGWVHGAPRSDWSPELLMQTPVRLSVNGREVAQGGGENIDGGPLGVLAWLADKVELPAGSYVSTGTTTNVHFGERGEHVSADFGPFGRIELEIT